MGTVCHKSVMTSFQLMNLSKVFHQSNEHCQGAGGFSGSLRTSRLLAEANPSIFPLPAMKCAALLFVDHPVKLCSDKSLYNIWKCPSQLPLFFPNTPRRLQGNNYCNNNYLLQAYIITQSPIS